jgi:branched-chain amino acid aminotransferase
VNIESRYAFFDGRIVPIDEARISILAVAVNYGVAVFEGIRAYWSPEREAMMIFRLEEHIDRLCRNGRMLFMESPLSPQELTGAIERLLASEGFRCDAYIRPLLYKSSNEIGPIVHDIACDLSIFATPLSRYLNTTDGIRAVVSTWRRIGDCAIPPRGKIAGSYVNAALAKSEAVLAGADEAVLLSEDGTVSEGSVSNLFMVRNGTLITPPVTAGILEGITRSTMLTLAAELGIQVIERTVQRSELYVADELFLCGTATEVAPLIEIDRRPVSDGLPGPITRRLRDRFAEVVHGRCEEHVDWCTSLPTGDS